ncbi:MAG TPA: response regulator [Chitinophagaceae bacterium]|mgnify:CR=1 FL=1|jgi:DNA-binding NtrC family response regulator|nr:response regulator [Chitinophagaceae bacterium]HRG91575.1 response regulator [Chitinophagaceae bacterium]
MNLKENAIIFIVDDDPFWGSLLEQMLEELGYHNIVKYKNGRDCLNNIHFRPSLVFLDYEMNDMNGLDVLSQVNRRYTDTNVVLCSAHENIGIAVNAMKSGAFDFIVKSKCNLNKLADLIAEMNENQIFAEKIF